MLLRIVPIKKIIAYTILTTIQQEVRSQQHYTTKTLQRHEHNRGATKLQQWFESQQYTTVVRWPRIEPGSTAWKAATQLFVSFFCSFFCPLFCSSSPITTSIVRVFVQSFALPPQTLFSSLFSFLCYFLFLHIVAVRPRGSGVAG